jgi:carboxypeptidase family protein/TonB-dependent receptor-like protein
VSIVTAGERSVLSEAVATGTGPSGESRVRRSVASAWWLVLCLLVLVCGNATNLLAQGSNAAINGQITDPQGKVVPGVEVQAININTNVVSASKTNDSGIFSLPSLSPGPYRLVVRMAGFKGIDKVGLILHVQDTLEQNFVLEIGMVAETVTVTANDLNINTTDGSVSTVIDQKFVENLPLNGRSFNTLLQLAPGVLIVPSSSQAPGQFSVNGQRTDANYFTVDGVSVNFGASAGTSLGQAGGGGTQAFNAFGGTSSLVSVDAMQEFRVQTSSVAPEYGHTPGGQISITTRSGTNDFHGSAFDYFRNTVLDANDWFANAAALVRAPEHQNDFGGVFGGPILHDSTFFFFSYEGLRLLQPQTGVTVVPSLTIRSSAVPSATPILDSFPLPNGPVLGDGSTAQFTDDYSNRITANAVSLRIDRVFKNGLSVFGRFNWAPSEIISRDPNVGSLNNIYDTPVGTRTITFGTGWQISPRINNAFRINFSNQSARSTGTLDSFGGAQPVATGLLIPSSFPLSMNTAYVSDFDAPSLTLNIGRTDEGSDVSQFNVLDDVSYEIGSHQVKMGVDYRQLSLRQDGYQLSPFYYIAATGTESATAQFAASGVVPALQFQTYRSGRVLIRNIGTYIQDTWKVTKRLTLTYGLRWEVNPAPSPRDGTVLSSWENVQNAATPTLAPAGTPVYNTSYGNFAPRVGVAYSLDESGTFVVRGGWGIFYDLGTGTAPFLLSDFPNSASNFIYPNTSPLPIPNYSSYAPTFSTTPPFPSGLFIINPNLKLPYTNEWNVAVEKSLGQHQSLSATYVGSTGRRLLRDEGIGPAQAGPNFPEGYGFLYGGTSSNYNALQLQYKRPVYRRVQALLNYTYSHSIDNASDDLIPHVSSVLSPASADRASSDFDVRHNFTGTLTFDIPSAKGAFLEKLTEDWSLAGVFQVRSGLPINIFTYSTADGSLVNDARPNLVPGMTIWVPDPTTGPGKKLNVNAFALPASGVQGDFPRNAVRGLGAAQIDLSIQRSFALTERLRLSFRTDAFNVLNHPNFANPYGEWEPASPSFGVFTQMLNRGLGGLNALYQIGGPRSLQLSLRLSF